MSRFVLTAQLQLQAPNNVAQVVRQIQSQLNNVNVNLNVQGSAQAQRQIQQVTTQTQAATTAADRMGRSFAIATRRFAAFSIATRAVSLFTSTLSNAVKSAIDFERELIKISQVTGKAMSQLKDLTREISNLATGFGVSSESLLSTTRILSQAGFKADDLTVALRTLAKTELAPTFDNITQTAEGAVAIFNQFQRGAAALEAQLGAINAVAGQFAVEAGDLIDVVRRAGGVFKASGGELNELIALFTSVRATTRESAESIGTGLRTIFTRIQRPKTIEFLKQFGVELTDLEGKFVGPFEAVRRLNAALAGLGEGDITFIRIAEELGGFRQIGKVLPLLQQFSVAQQALNVANKAGNSLSEDAAKAQAALAVRIMKVKEEFLALIRSMTETSTFQIMANTALSLAEALIKIGDAIKPLLPMLAAVAAIRFARGIGNFATSFMSGMQSGRTYSTGGKVHHFARGGMVPGTGNRDTVPAMLQPGEFVIKKSSVNKLGASNLAAMNENRYNRGTQGRGIVGATKQLKSVEKRKNPYGPKESVPGSGMIKFNVNDGEIGAFVLQPAKGTEGSYTATKPFLFTLPPSNRYAQLAAKQAGLSKEDIAGGINASINPASYPVFYPGMNEGRSNLQKNAKYAQAVTKGFNDAISTGVNSTIQSVTSQGLLDIPPAYNTNESLLRNTIASIQSDNQVRSSIEGYLFEGMISAFTGAQAAGGRANFDFPRSAISQNKDKLATLFGSGPMINKLIKAEAKRSYGEVGGNIQRKLANDIIAGYKGGVSIQTVGKKFATGGGVGTDTVPALLTPGEFVVNRSSAQRIGYGNLNRMNKVGKYARGGVVQRFAQGTTMSGVAPVTSGGGNVIGLDALSNQAKALADAQAQLTNRTQQASQAADQSASSAMQVVNNNKMFAATMATSLIGGFLPAVDEASSGMLKVTHHMVGLATTLTSVMFALEAFGVSLSAKSIMQLFGTGPGGLGSLMKNAFSGFKMGAAGMAGPQPLGGGMASRVGGMFGRGRDLLSRGVGSVRSRLNNSALGSFESNLSSSFRAGFGGGKQGINPLFAAAKGRNPFVGMGGGMGVSALKTGVNQLGFGGRTSARLGGFAGRVSNTFDQGRQAFGRTAFAQGFGGGRQGINPLFAAAKARNPFVGMGGKMGVSALQTGVSQLGLGGRTAARLGGVAGRVTQGIGGVLGKGAGLAARAGGAVAGGLGGVGSAALSMAGPIAGITGFVAILNGAVGAFKDLDGQLQKSIQAGKVEEASKLAVAKAAADFPLIGNLVQGVLGDFGDEILVWAGRAFGGSSLDSVKALAAAQAGAVRTQKELDKAQKDATNAMEDFQNGSISASEALSRIRAASSEVVNQEKRASEFATSNLENRASDGFTGRNVASFLTFGAVESSTQRNQRLGQQSAEQIDQAAKFEAQRFQMESGARAATIRSGFARGRSAADIRTEAMGDLQGRLSQQRMLGATLQSQGDEAGAKAAFAAAAQLEEQIKQVDREMASLEKEVGRAKAAFEAMDLGLRGPIATATAMSASMDRFSAGLEVGGNTFVANTQFLSQAMSSAAQAMDPDEIKAAMKDVSNNLRDMGVDPTKFEANTQAFIQAQQNYNKAFENIKDRIKGDDFTGMDADTLKKEFASELTAGLGDDAKKNLTAIIEGMELSDSEVDAILGGNLQIFGDKLGEAGQKQFEEIMKIAQERQKAEQVVIGLIRQRADAERQLAQAQKDAIDLYMEGRDVQAKYGGAPVESGERRAAILARANAGASGAGIGNLRTGSVAELRQRQTQIVAGFGNVERMRRVDGGMAGTEGVKADEMQKNLDQAQKDQVETIRALIKLEEEELKIIQEKNKLEKDSLESLISGDIDKFFEQQAAVGAQAAIATGDMSLANMFGGKAIGDAFKDMQRQAEAGVQSLYGQRLGGAGGLLERGAGAALSARGVTDPRMAQRLAGTTAAEEASKATLRELGGVLGEAGMAQTAMAEMQVQTANINVTNAELKLNEIEERGRKAAANMYRGGPVYANRGIFVPRGTDTVPAMLTPGEFVVRREAVNRGNNLQLLRAINSGGNAGGFARGGKVGYYNNGGIVQYKALGDLVSNLGKSIGIDPQMITNLGNVFTTFVNGFNESIKNLRETKVQVKMDSVNVNVNFTGAGMLNQISDSAKQSVIQEVIQKLQSEYGIGANGNITQRPGNLATPSQGQ